MQSRFPELQHRVEFWHVDDVGDAPPSVALPLIERGVLEDTWQESPEDIYALTRSPQTCPRARRP